MGNDRVVSPGLTAPEFGLRRVTTTLRLRDGESNLLADCSRNKTVARYEGSPACFGYRF